MCRYVILTIRCLSVMTGHVMNSNEQQNRNISAGTKRMLVKNKAGKS